MKDITAYIAKHKDWKGKILSQLREIVLSASTDMVEEWKWNSPVWSEDGLVCAASAFKNHVKLNFFQGANLKDKDSLFNGGLDSKKSRSIDFYEDDRIKKKELKSLIIEALNYNRQKLG